MLIRLMNLRKWNMVTIHLFKKCLLGTQHVSGIGKSVVKRKKTVFHMELLCGVGR